jgi:hypothetical protein
MARTCIALIVSLLCFCEVGCAEDFDSLVQSLGSIPQIYAHFYAYAVKRKEAWLVQKLKVSSHVDVGQYPEEIAKFKTIEDINFTGQSCASNKSLRALTTMPNLQSITMSFNCITLENISALENLKYLDAGNALKLKGSALVHLKNFTKLRSLKLSYDTIDESLICIKDMRDLEELELPARNISDDLLAKILPLPKLNSLAICFLGPKCLAALKRCPRLRKLNIEYVKPEVRDLSALIGLESFKLGDFNNVSLPDNLRELEVNGWTTEDSDNNRMPFKGSPPKYLEKVCLRLWCALGPVDKRADLNWLRQLPKLRELVLQQPYKDEVSVAAELTGLRALTLDEAGGVITDEDLIKIARAKQLESLTILQCGVDITNAGIKALEGLHELRSLKLGYRGQLDNLTPVALESIWKMSKLEMLQLPLPDGTTDENMAGIVSLQHLRELELEGTVTDKTLEYISKLKNLRKLNMTRCPGFSDEALIKLVGQLPNLDQLAWIVRGVG